MKKITNKHLVNLLLVAHYGYYFNKYNLYYEENTNNFFERYEISLTLEKVKNKKLSSYEKDYNDTNNFIKKLISELYPELVNSEHKPFNVSNEYIADELDEFKNKTLSIMKMDEVTLNLSTLDEERFFVYSKEALKRISQRWALLMSQSDIKDSIPEKFNRNFEDLSRKMTCKRVTGNANGSSLALKELIASQS